MRFITAAIIVICGTQNVRGGLFDPDKPTVDLAEATGLMAIPHDSFRLRLADVWAIGTPFPETASRRKAIAERDALLSKGTLTTADLVRLGVLRTRLREYEAARAELQNAYGQNARDFWSMSALGTLSLQTGQPMEACKYLEVARDLSASAANLSAAAKAACEAEYRLARLRMRELAGLPGGRRPPPPEDVDDLFGVQFIGASGEYEAGTMAPAEKAKLPADAIAIVQQLLLWYPDDGRLFWLLAELYNATGDLDSALVAFNECADARRIDAARLMRHRQAIQAAIDARPTGDDSWRPSHARLWLVGGAAAAVVAALFALQFRQVARRWLR